jgi:hypothetical protein
VAFSVEHANDILDASGSVRWVGVHAAYHPDGRGPLSTAWRGCAECGALPVAGRDEHMEDDFSLQRTEDPTPPSCLRLEDHISDVAGRPDRLR